jgi:hypothetical protein
MTPRPARKPVRVPSIIEVADSQLLGRWFEGASWAAHRTLLKCLFALPLDTAEVPLFEACTGRTMPPPQSAASLPRW